MLGALAVTMGNPHSIGSADTFTYRLVKFLQSFLKYNILSIGMGNILKRRNHPILEVDNINQPSFHEDSR